MSQQYCNAVLRWKSSLRIVFCNITFIINIKTVSVRVATILRKHKKKTLKPLKESLKNTANTKEDTDGQT